MNLKFLRASSINSYKGCEFAFFMEQVLELPSKGGKKAMLGTIVHHVLELMAKGKKLGHSEGFIFDHIKLLDICWNRYCKENQEMALKGADKKFCLKSIEKVLDSHYDPRKLNVLHTEKQFRIPLESKDFSFEFYDILKGTVEKGCYEIRGTIDLITQVDKDTIEVIDWKTGSRKCWNTGEEKEFDYLQSKDIQLRMYDLACYFLFPEYKNRMLTINFINDGGPFTVTFDDESRKETLNIIKNMFKTISWNQLPSRLKETKASESWKCKSVCHFGKTMTSAGCSICDTVHSYVLGNGIDQTIVEMDRVKKKQEKQKEAKTSERRNVFE